MLGTLLVLPHCHLSINQRGSNTTSHRAPLRHIHGLARSLKAYGIEQQVHDRTDHHPLIAMHRLVPEVHQQSTREPNRWNPCIPETVPLRLYAKHMQLFKNNQMIRGWGCRVATSSPVSSARRRHRDRMSPTAGPPSTRTISAVLPPSSETGRTCATRVVSCRS